MKSKTEFQKEKKAISEEMSLRSEKEKKQMEVEKERDAKLAE